MPNQTRAALIALHDVERIWNLWRWNLPQDRGFSHNEGLAFITAIRERAAESIYLAASPVAQEPEKPWTRESWIAHLNFVGALPQNAREERRNDCGRRGEHIAGPEFFATHPPLYICSHCLTEVRKVDRRSTPPVSAEAPTLAAPLLCECGHAWESHTGHTVASHLPEREQHNTHCSCCYNCGAFRPVAAPPAGREQEREDYIQRLRKSTQVIADRIGAADPSQLPPAESAPPVPGDVQELATKVWASIFGSHYSAATQQAAIDEVHAILASHQHASEAERNKRIVAEESLLMMTENAKSLQVTLGKQKDASEALKAALIEIAEGGAYSGTQRNYCMADNMRIEIARAVLAENDEERRRHQRNAAAYRAALHPSPSQEAK
jgi:hypothetical protein